MTLAKIVYASMTGNTEEIADIVAEAFEDLELEVEIDECTQVDAADFEEADICVVVQETRFMMIFVNRWTTSKQSLLKLGQKKAPTALKLI